MKILYFYQYFTTPRGSWGTRAYEFARRWVEAGHEVTVITSAYEKSDLTAGRVQARSEIDGIDVRVLGPAVAHTHGFTRRVTSFLLFALLASWRALVSPADLVLCSSGPITVGIPGLVARWLRRRQVVFEVRDLWPEGAVQLNILRNRALIRLASWLEAACYRSADRVIALSPGQAADIRRRFPDVTVSIVPNASDNDLARTAPPLEPVPEWTSGKKLLVYAGTLGLIDDCGQLIELASTLKGMGRRDLVVTMIGDGNERPQLERWASERGLDNVRFLGAVSRREVFSWLGHATAAIITVKPLPFLDTASPNKLFDAFAAGLPVIQTTQGWIRELLAAEECGLTVPAGDGDAMARAVLRLADDRELHATLSANARRLALMKFDRGLLAAEMLTHLEQAGNR